MCPVVMCNKKKLDMKRETERGCGGGPRGFLFYIGESENVVLKEF